MDMEFLIFPGNVLGSNSILRTVIHFYFIGATLTRALLNRLWRFEILRQLGTFRKCSPVEISKVFSGSDEEKQQ